MRCSLISFALCLVACGSSSSSSPVGTSPVDSGGTVPDPGTTPTDSGATAEDSATVVDADLGQPDAPSPTMTTKDSGSPTDSGGAADVVHAEAAPACLPPSGDCTGSVNGCCNGSTCTTSKGNPRSFCADNCRTGADCVSGCCAPLGNAATNVCVASAECSPACVGAGELCSGATCCAGNTCVSSTVSGVRCQANCTSGSQCASGCCAPLPNTPTVSVCSPSNFCAP